jgi:membrane-bound lytic murein transglycosylase A
MVTQDTGGAIKGPVRGDIFFGGGDWAEWNAGHMKGQGAIWVLLPHLLTSDLLASLEP